jgi:DnaK suppressor protein
MVTKKVNWDFFQQPFKDKREMPETRMNEAEIEQFRQKLLSLRTELQKLEESSKEAAMSGELDKAAVGGLSRRDAMQAHLIAREPARRRQRQLGKIEGALRRIEAGEYGNCFICGEENDIQRLSVDPTNTRCIKCVES